MSSLIRLGAAADRDAIGGKAASLLLLAKAGLRVPPALVLGTEVFRAMRAAGPALPGDLVSAGGLAAVERAHDALATAAVPVEILASLPVELAWLAPAGATPRFAVRSSANVEDRPGALAAGIFLSAVDVPPAGVADAARAVLASALAPAAAAYATGRGLPLAELAMAVLVHPFVAGDAAGTAAWDPSAQPAPAIEVGAGGDQALTPAARETIARAARTLAAAHGPVEIEWVATGDAVVFLQLRPYQAPRARRWGGTAALEKLGGGPWSWDAAHNPLPLSPAQAGLVAFADTETRTVFRQAVVGGYLFASPSGEATPAPAASPAFALQTLDRDVKARLSGREPTLEEALATFGFAYEQLYGAIQPAARAAIAALGAFLGEHVERPPPVGALLVGVGSRAGERAARASAIARAAGDEAARRAAIAAYVDGFGDEAPVWDVAVATYAEDRAALARAVVGEARTGAAGDDPEARVRAALPRALHDPWRARLAAAREAAAVAEDDDAVYAGVQAAVRHALVREGRRLAAASVLARPEDVFWLPLEAVRRDARGEEALTAPRAAAAVAEARRAHADALADPPPTSAAPDTPGLVRGRPGAPGRAIGRVRLHPSPPGAPAPADADAVVARTLLPTELPLVAAAALVVETGGVLGHVAAQARERRIPAVTDAPNATTIFADGDLVLVDGDAGLVVKLRG